MLSRKLKLRFVNKYIEILKIRNGSQIDLVPLRLSCFLLSSSSNLIQNLKYLLLILDIFWVILSEINVINLSKCRHVPCNSASPFATIACLNSGSSLSTLIFLRNASSSAAVSGLQVKSLSIFAFEIGFVIYY